MSFASCAVASRVKLARLSECTVGACDDYFQCPLHWRNGRSIKTEERRRKIW